MAKAEISKLMARIGDGRTDLVVDLLAAGVPAATNDGQGVSLMQHCAYYGDVSAMKALLVHGASLGELGDDLGLGGAAFHGHWRLCQFLLESGADANFTDAVNGETALHAALCKTDAVVSDRVLQVLLSCGADPNRQTVPGAETGGFMRDVRCKGETPLHRAAAFGESSTIQLLLDAGAQLDAKDANGDSPLSWASWYLRADGILRQLCYGNWRVREGRKGMRAYLLGEPHPPA
jgi:uncharacterized protein